jgi:putative peptidoglycan lipid II flippase
MVGALMYQISRWRERVRSVHPDHLRIAWATMRISAFVLIGKCTGALKEMAIAYKYGISNVVDAYQFTTTIVTWLPTTLLSVMSIVLVPVFVNLRSRSSEDRARLVGEIEGVAVAIGVLLALLLYVSWPIVIRAIGGDLSPITREMCRRLMYWLAPTSVLILVSSIFAARLQARERHINTLLDGIPAALVLISVLSTDTAQSIAPLVFGTIVGLVLQVVWLKLLAARADGVKSRARLSMHCPEWKSMWLSIRTLMVGQVVFCFCPPLDQYFAARLGEGASSTLGYASRVILLLLSMGAMAAAQAALPIFSDILKRGDIEHARRTALFWGLAVFALGVVCAAASWLLAPEVIAVLFQRGAFTATDTQRVADVFRWGLLQVPFYFGLQVLSGLFASEGRFKVMANIAVATFAIKVAGNFLLVRHFGIAGVQISTGLMYGTAFFLSMGMLRGGARPSGEVV